jgi:hypothetical protein
MGTRAFVAVGRRTDNRKGKCGGSSPFDFAQGQNDKQELTTTKTATDNDKCPAEIFAQRLKPRCEQSTFGTHSASLRAGSEAVPLSKTDFFNR